MSKNWSFYQKLSSFFGTKNRQGLHSSKLKIEQLEDRRMLAVLSIGSGDGAVQVDVDGYGSFGRSQEGTAFGDATIDSIGSGGPIGLVFESGVAFGSNSNRRFLSDGFIGSSSSLPTIPINVSLDNTSATSLFTLAGLTGSLAGLNGLSFQLVQELSPIMDNTTQVGALLTQTYVMTNTTSSSINLDLVRYIDVDVADTGSSDGGGRIILGGEEWIATTGSDTVMSIDQSDRFVAISTEGGIEPLTGRFEVDFFNTLLESTTIPGGNLDDSVFNDSLDADFLIDLGTYDTTGALRSDF